MKKLEITLDNLKGFWYPVFIWIIKRLYQTISIGYHLNIYYNKREKGGAWVSEFYQIIGVILGVVWVFLIEQPILTGRFWVYLGVCVALYKPLEIFLFILDWLFVQERNPVKKYTRSLAGFLLNMVEIGLFFTIVDILCNSTNSYVSVWFTVKDNIYRSLC